MQTKQEWIEYFNKEPFPNNIFHMTINGKNCRVSYFYKYAPSDIKADKYLNALNFEKNGRFFELAPNVIDFEFIKEVYHIKKSMKVFSLPYEWKNNPQEKQLLDDILVHHSDRHKYYIDMNWWFKPGFWSDLDYTKKIKSYDYHFLNTSIIKAFNSSSKSDEINIALNIVNQDHSYLKSLAKKHQHLLHHETVLAYVKESGLTSLNKFQKNTYEVIKTAFHHRHINYHEIDNKWKTPEFLVDLLNNKSIWNNDFMSLDFLTPQLQANKDVMKSCMAHGKNLIKLRENQNELFFDKELKLIALENYADYKIIEDCLDDKEIVLKFISTISRLPSRLQFNGINLFEQTKRIREDTFKDKEVMTKYLSLKALDNDAYFVSGAIKALQSYSTDDVIEFININAETYKVLPDQLKLKWEFVAIFYQQNKGISNKMPSELRDKINSFGYDFTKCMNSINNCALEEKLSRTLEKKEYIKRIKI